MFSQKCYRHYIGRLEIPTHEIVILLEWILISRFVSDSIKTI